MPNLLRPLSVGEILDGAFALYRRNFIQLISVGAVLFGGTFLLGQLSDILGWMALMVTTVVVQAALIWLSSELIHERSPSLGQVLKVGFARLVPLALMMIVFSIIIGVGTVLLLIPGLIAMVYFFAYAQIVVLERRMNFLDRSTQLVRGGFWKVAGVSIVGYIIVLLPSMILAVGNLTLVSQAQQLESPLSFGWMQALQFALNVMLVPFTAMLTTLLYYERRVVVEGLDVEGSASELERSIQAAL